MRIPSGVTDQYIYFVAVDSTDFTTRETGLSSFTVYRSRNGGAAAAMTTPTINETDTTNMPGVYELLLDEDMTIDAGDDSQEMCFHITHAGMAPVTRTIELYRPKITAGNTLGVASDGDISGNLDGTVATVTTLTGHTAQTGDCYARLGAPAGASVSADIATIDSNVDAILVDTGTTLPATLGTPAGADMSTDIAAIKTETAAILVDTGTTLDTKLNDIQGATFSSATDSLEALRDRGDSAWTGSATTSDSGTAQAGAAGSITLQAGASAVDNTYLGQVIYISSGTGAGQSRAIDGYTGSSKVATVITNWATTPDATSVYEIYPDDITEVTAAPTAAAVADAVWDENTAGHTTAGTFGEQCKNDIDAILTDTGTTLDAAITTIDANVDAILVDTGTTLPATLGTPAGADLATDVAAIKADTAATLVDTATLGAPAGASHAADIAAIKSDTAAILVDTNELQTDDIPTTLATLATAANLATVDTVVDAIKVKTDQLAFGVANQVDANVESINTVTVVGAGVTANKWRA